LRKEGLRSAFWSFSLRESLGSFLAAAFPSGSLPAPLFLDPCRLGSGLAGAHFALRGRSGLLPASDEGRRTAGAARRVRPAPLRSSGLRPRGERNGRHGAARAGQPVHACRCFDNWRHPPRAEPPTSGRAPGPNAAGVLCVFWGVDPLREGVVAEAGGPPGLGLEAGNAKRGEALRAYVAAPAGFPIWGPWALDFRN